MVGPHASAVGFYLPTAPRDRWDRHEAVHDVVCFAPEVRAAADALGLPPPR